jgi:ABC-type transport system involved in cytochrome c biogenesis permease subunit
MIFAYAALSGLPASGKMDLAAAGRLPVVDGGRVKPLDTVARVDMRLMSGREEYADGPGRMRPAIEWFFDTAAAAGSPDKKLGPAGQLQIIRIENDQVRQVLGLPYRDGLRYSLEEMREKWGEFEAAVDKADARPPKQRDLFDTKLLETHRQVMTFLAVRTGKVPLVLPPTDGRDWRSADQAKQAVSRQVLDAFMREFPDVKDPHAMNPQQQARAEEVVEAARAAAEAKEPAYKLWDQILAAYRARDAATFNRLVAEYRATQYGNLSGWDAFRVELESFLNGFAPFFYITGLYVLAFLLAVAGWAGMVLKPSLGESLRRASFSMLAVVFVVHFLALMGRMYLMGRPLVFVTNLYSSAVFIGCAAVGMCLIIERASKIGLGNAVAGLLGFGTCVLAHNLAAGGDTLEMMQAVLDTNFWLATHVTTITLGYAATYVAGLIGVIYIVFGIATPLLDRPVPFGAKPLPLGRVIGMVMYAVICGATLLSFVGTVLGGIWADQSWGRFWGWDPKENGAVMIVIWNALILHARWAGLVKDRGVAVLALVGNMITTWSYFGTNQLGIGLHAYGFNNALAAGCAITWLVHLALIASGLTPKSFWTSGVRPAPTESAAAAAAVFAPAAPTPVTVSAAAPETNGHANGHPPKGGKGKKAGKRR